MKIEVGTVLWRMRGIERNGIVRWYAAPDCVEQIDDRKFLFGNGCGASLNAIGTNYFLSRDEAIHNHLSMGGELEQEFKEDAEEITRLPPTDFQDQIIYKFNHGVNDCGVYVGGLSQLKDITSDIVWNCISLVDDEYYEESLSLSQIYDQVSRLAGHEYDIITVIQNDPLRAQIYQCNNYERGKWVCLADNVMGYA